MQLKGGVRGKHYKRATGGMNLVLIEPDLATVFPDEESANRAPGFLLNAGSAAGVRSRRGRSWPNKLSRGAVYSLTIGNHQLLILTKVKAL